MAGIERLVRLPDGLTGAIPSGDGSIADDEVERILTNPTPAPLRLTPFSHNTPDPNQDVSLLTERCEIVAYLMTVA